MRASSLSFSFEWPQGGDEDEDERTVLAALKTARYKPRFCHHQSCWIPADGNVASCEDDCSQIVFLQRCGVAPQSLNQKEQLGVPLCGSKPGLVSGASTRPGHAGVKRCPSSSGRLSSSSSSGCGGITEVIQRFAADPDNGGR